MDYIINEKNACEHYFLREGKGVQTACEKNMFLPETIFKDAKKAFCVFKKEDVLHIICVNGKNELVYIPKKDGEYKQYVLCELKEGFDVKEIKITASGEMLNLLCSAEYEGEMLLIHCVLGNQAKPSVIDKMQEQYFFVYKERVYYTNKSGVLGYQELTDGKPDRFIKAAEGAFKPYLYEDEGNKYLVYIKDGAIYLNNILKYEDCDAETPVIARRGERLILIWKSGAVLKYVDLKTGGADAPKRVISTGTPVLYSIQEGENIYYDYAAECDGRPYFSEMAAETNFTDGGLQGIIGSVLKIKEEIKEIEEKIKNLK